MGLSASEAMGIAQGATQTASGLGKTIYGGIQKYRAKQERERLLDQQPQYETPQSIDELTSLYGQQLSDVRRTEKMPGEDQMRSNLKQSTQRGISDIRQTARSSAEALGATTDVIGKEIEGLKQLDIQSAQQQARREIQATQMYGQSLKQQAQYEDKEWRYNEWMPWKTELAQAQANFAGGQKTMQSGISDLTSGVTMGAMQMAGGNGDDTTNDPPPNYVDSEPYFMRGNY